MSRKLTLGTFSVSLGAYVLFRRVSAGLITLGALMAFFQILLTIIAFLI